MGSSKVFTLCGVRVFMARRVPQNKDALIAARRALSTYATKYEAAASLGISTGTLRKIERGTGRVRESTAARIKDASSADDLRTISVNELLGMVEYYESSEILTPQQRQSKRAAERALDKAETQGLGPGDRVERPKLKKGISEWRLGRGKSEQSRRSWEKEMRKKGYKGDLQGYYDEATGYTRM